MVRDTTVMTWEAVKAGKEVLFEGAQGTLLDLDMGTYPFVTSSHPVAGGCCIGSGVGPTAITEIMGIFQSYPTRVGEGPLPTELFAETRDYIRNAARDFRPVPRPPRPPTPPGPGARAAPPAPPPPPPPTPPSGPLE